MTVSAFRARVRISRYFACAAAAAKLHNTTRPCAYYTVYINTLIIAVVSLILSAQISFTSEISSDSINPGIQILYVHTV